MSLLPFPNKIQVTAFSVVSHISTVARDANAVVTSELSVKLDVAILL